MAIDFKKLITSAFIELCNEKPLKKIKIDDILKHSGVSRQTFYNHFHDKNELIQYFYQTYIISKWHTPDKSLDFCEACLSCFYADKKYHRIIKQAIQLGGQNNLSDFMYEHSRIFDRKWHQAFNNGKELSEIQLLASDYHSDAGMRLRILWILNGMPISPEQLTEQIISMRIYGIKELFFENETGSDPYSLALKKLQNE